MRLGLRFWGFHHVIVDPRQWQREQETHSPVANYEVLDLWHAELVLRQIAREDGDFLNCLGREVLWSFRGERTAPGTYERQEENRRLLEELIGALGSRPHESGEPPRFASIYVCQRKRAQFVAEPRPPLIEPIETDYPRIDTQHYVVIETVDPQGHRVPGIRCELVIAGGEVRTVSTGPSGMVHVDRIQAGRVIIRVPDLDISMWRQGSGDAPTLSSGGSSKRVHVVRPGECLSKIAHQYGIKSWKTVWEDPKNEQLRKKRKSPHVVHPGDEVFVPSLRVGELARTTDATHQIVVLAALAEFRVRLQDHNQCPFKNEAYELLASSSSEEARKGTTDGDGKVLEQLPPTTRTVSITLPRLRLTWSFELSTLAAIPGSDEALDKDAKPSVHAVKAAQARLNALGFPCGKVDGLLGPRTRAALALFDKAEQNADGQPEGTDSPLDDTRLARLDSMFRVMA